MATWQEALDDSSTETEHDTWDHTGLTGVGGTFAGVRVHNDAAQSLTNNAWTALTFNTERFDTDTFHSTASNTSRLTVPSGKAGKYHIGGGATTDNNATGSRFIRVILNGATVLQHGHAPTTSSFDSRLFVSTLYDLAEADYVELEVFQNSGGALDSLVSANSSPEFWMYKVG